MMDTPLRAVVLSLAALGTPGAAAFVLTAGVSYQVADNAESHRSFTATGAKLFIVD